jgi:hypothetical protein
MSQSNQFELLEPRSMCSVTPLGVNLVVNGDFEASGGETKVDANPSAIPGWNPSYLMAVRPYGTRGFPTAAQGPADGGNNFLSGIKQPPFTNGVIYDDAQLIDVSSLAADIDAGRLNWNFAAELGGFGAERDAMIAEIGCFNADKEPLLFQRVDGPSAAQRGYKTGFQPRQMTDVVPTGTRYFQILLTASLVDGQVADGYADNVSLKLTSTASKSRGFVAGTVFNDVSGNGTREDGESPMAGVTVFADLNNNHKLDKAEPRATTGRDGRYEIAGVRPGTVKIRQIAPKTFRDSTGTQTVRVTGGTAASPSNVNFGDSQSVLISGSVFADNNDNGNRDDDEGGFAGTLVSIHEVRTDGQPVKTLFIPTDDNGNFSFVRQPGRYLVEFVGADGVRQSFPANNQGFTVTLSKGQTSLGHIFGAKRI